VASLYSLANQDTKTGMSAENEYFEKKSVNSLMNSRERYLLRAIKCHIKNQNKINLLQRDKEILLDEWKEVARRMDAAMLLVNFLVVTIVPIYLFGRYAVFDIKSGPTKGCGCQLK